MTIIQDGWTPLFKELEQRLSSSGRRSLLAQMIGDVVDVTVLNFGSSGLARPSEWSSLTSKYAKEYHDGDQTPTLELSGALKEGFVWEIGDTVATLTNSVQYADAHQFGVSEIMLPARPFYPVNEDGTEFTPFMEERLLAIINQHFAV